MENDNNKAINLAIDSIIKHEGFEPTIYSDVVGIKTLGYGFTDPKILSKYMNGITEAQARSELLLIVNKIANDVKKSLGNINLNSYQLGALYSFVFNVGIGAFNKSTLLKKIKNNASDQEICQQFMRWVYAGGKVYKGLENRRKAELKLYLTKEEKQHV